MVCRNPGCLGHFDFENIANFARKRFVEGCSTVALLQQACSVREKQEIVLVSLLDVEDDQIRDLKLSCSYDGQCKVMDCRDKLKKLIQNELDQ
ncbi:MAG TPA: hypothetical protein ENJ80_10935 [Gammaproteobacteria bacterium]|nr:hypothetical protein [Gammaproteobacteria bacterium]